jgi:hypothetical protein
LQLLRFDDAGTGDQKQWFVEADLKTTEVHRTVVQAKPAERARSASLALPFQGRVGW